MTKFMDEDARLAFTEAERDGRQPPGEVHARGIKRKNLIRDMPVAVIARRGRESRDLRRGYSTEVLVSRGDASFGPDGENWWV